MMKAARFSPKTETPALPGSLHAEYVRCGKPTCRCAAGARHGPYFRRHWMTGGRKRSAYVRLADLDITRAAVQRWRLSHVSIRELIRQLRVLDVLADRLEAQR